MLRVLPPTFKPVNNLICCKTGFMLVVKRATLLYNSFCSNVAWQVKCFFVAQFSEPLKFLALTSASSSGASFFAWQRRARNKWLVMNRKGPWEGYRRQAKRRLARCLLPAFLCAHNFIKRETSGYEAALTWRHKLKPPKMRSLKPYFNRFNSKLHKTYTALNVREKYSIIWMNHSVYN